MIKEETDDYIIRARGLPWSATKQDIEKFFSGSEITGGAENGIHFTYSHDGRPSGECFVEFTSPGDYERALAKNKEHMGKRYVEVFEAKRNEMEWACKREQGNMDDHDNRVVRLRGLPYGCSKEEVANFFQRYIEIFHSTIQEARSAMMPRPRPLMAARFGPYDRKGFGGGGPGFGGRASGFERRYRGGGRGGYSGMRSGRDDSGGFGRSSGGFGSSSGSGGGLSKSTTGHCIHMRGLPFSATENDVKQWFMPLNPVNVRMEFEISGSGQRRSRGEADVDFATEADAKAAMAKDKQNMGHRYIELFLRSEFNGGTSGGGDWSTGDQPFFSGNGMNFSNHSGVFGNNGNSSAGGFNPTPGAGGYNSGGYGGSSNNYGGSNTSYGGGYGGSQSSGMVGNTGFFGITGGQQGGQSAAMMGSGMFGGQQGGINSQTAGAYNAGGASAGAFSSTASGAFNSSSNYYGQNTKTGMVSYPSQY